MYFSILHTSARPQEWRKVYRAWLDAAQNQADFEYILLVDARWGFSSLPTMDRPQDRAYWVPGSGPINYVRNVNHLAGKASGKVFIVNADDQFPAEKWDLNLKRAIHLHVPGGIRSTDEFLLGVTTHTQMEREKGICVMPVLSRSRFERLGYIFYPHYESMYADQDLADHAKHDECYYELGEEYGVFPHLHPIITGKEIDEACAVQNRAEAYALGAALLERRRANKFTEVTESITVRVRPVIAVCLPGETFSASYVSSWTALLCYLMENFNVIPIFTYSSNVYNTRACLLDTVYKVAPRPEYILWIDDDNTVEPNQFNALLESLNANPSLTGVAGWCWIGSSATGVQDKLSCGVIDAETGKDRPYTYADLAASPTHLVPVDYSGFPVFLMRTANVTPIRAAAPSKNPFLPIINPAYLFGMSGEDTAFCSFARANGGSFAVDRRVKVPHLKLNSVEPYIAPPQTTSSVPEAGASVQECEEVHRSTIRDGVTEAVVLQEV